MTCVRFARAFPLPDYRGLVLQLKTTGNIKPLVPPSADNYSPLRLPPACLKGAQIYFPA